MTKLTDNMPKHDMYVELFSANKSLLFDKMPVTSEVYNDVNRDIVDLFEVIRKNGKEFVTFVKGEVLDDVDKSNLHKYDKWERLKDIYESFNKCNSLGNLSSIRGYREVSSDLNKELSSIDESILKIVRRLRTVQFENRRFDDLINRFDKRETIFYADVTNLPSDVTHSEVVERLLNLKGNGILYGADSKEYEELIDEGWMRLEDYPGEVVWINYRI